MHRPRLPRMLVALYDAADRHDVSRAASAMAFDLFLGLVPLMALLGWLAAWVARRGPALLEIRVLELAPTPAARIVREQFMRLERPGESLAPFALAGFFWLASGSAHVALSTVRTILGLPSRSYVQTRLLAFAFTLAAILLSIVSSVTIFLIVRLVAIGAMSPVQARAWNLVVAVFTTLATLAGVAALYRMAAGKMGRSSYVLPGAIVAVVSFGSVSWLFSFYVARLAKYAAFYGALASVAVLLVWLWLSSLALLLGAEVNAYLTDRRGVRASIASPVD